MELTTAANLALLILRVVVGLTLAAHGWNKFTGGGKIPGTGRWFDSIGMRPGRLNAYLAASTEMGAGVLLALGLLHPLAAAGVIGVMTGAGWTSHRTNGFFIIKEGWEYVFVLSAAALVSATLGPGEWSVDEGLGIATDLDGMTGFLIALLVGVGGGIAQMLTFYRPSSVASGDRLNCSRAGDRAMVRPRPFRSDGSWWLPGAKRLRRRQPPRPSRGPRLGAVLPILSDPHTAERRTGLALGQPVRSGYLGPL